MENDRTQGKKTKKNKLERIAKIQYEKFKRILEHKMKLHNSIARISQIAAIPIVMSFTTDDNAMKNINEDRNPNKFPTENTVGAVSSESLVDIQNQEIEKKFAELIAERQEKFLQELYTKMNENIAKIKQSEKKGVKSKTLRETFGKSVNTRYYCAYGALTTINQVAESDGFQEFNFLNEYIENPHACLSVIAGLKNKDRNLLEDIDNYTKSNPSVLELNAFLKNIRFRLAKNPPSEEINKIIKDVKIKLSENNGDTVGNSILQRIETHLEKAPIVVETNNIKKEIAIQMEKNPNSVLIVVHNSTGNRTASGKHAGLVMKKIDPKTSEKGTTVFAGYNGEKIQNVDDYFQKSNNVGLIYNITEKAAQELKKNNYTEFAQEQNKILGNTNLLAWSEVSSVQEFDVKTVLLANARKNVH